MGPRRDKPFGMTLHDADAPLHLEDRASYPTAGEVVRQIALVITVCLALALLARLIIHFVGIY